jgi:uncharacterized protein
MTTAGRRAALIDTSAYYALANRRDAHHESAVAIARRLAEERWRLYTTNLVVAETHGLVLARVNRDTALHVLHEILTSSAAILRIGPPDEMTALRILERYDDKDFSLTDATSFVAMQRRGIGYAFAFDRHFQQYGFFLLE